MQDFRDIVRLMSGHYKEVYIRYGVRHFGITERTAEKRLNDALSEKDSKIFETPDPQDARRKRVFHQDLVKSKSAVSIGSPIALNAVARDTLKNCLKLSNWENRLRGFASSLQTIRAAMLQLEECVAASYGRNKFNKERNQLQRTLIEIHKSIKSDPEYDKISILLDKGLIPQHPYTGAIAVLRTKRFAMDKLPSPHKLARRTGIRGKKRRLQKSQKLGLFYG
jgi:hypothetical protein